MCERGEGVRGEGMRGYVCERGEGLRRRERMRPCFPSFQEP